MTPEQIKARCKQFTEEESSDYDCRQFSLSAIESLYREAMAKGLEMAATKANRYPCAGEARRGMACFADWCMEQANTLKEPT